MAEPKKRLWIRAPLTEEDYANAQRYYSESDIESILLSFKARPDLDQNQFAQDLEIAAYWVVNLAAADKAKPPSTLQREWDWRAKKIEELLADLSQMGMRERADLEYAAEQLAQRTGELPDLEPGRVDLPPVPGEEPTPSDFMTVWPVTEQIEKSLTALRWLHQCFAGVASRAKNDKAEPGNRPIEAKHVFYQTIVGIYEEYAEKPRKPQKDRIRGDLTGEVLDMLQACLEPLGVSDSRAIIYKTYYRAWKPRRRSPKAKAQRNLV